MPVQEPHFFESVRQYLSEYFGGQDQVKLDQLYKSAIAEMMKDPGVSQREAHERLCNYVMGLAAKGFRKRHPPPTVAEGSNDELVLPGRYAKRSAKEGHAR